jgi:hypothetical protein
VHRVHDVAPTVEEYLFPQVTTPEVDFFIEVFENVNVFEVGVLETV